MAKTAQAFIDQFNGKVIDYDGVYGAQCVDGYKQWCNWIKAPVLATKTGWADGYWTHRIDYSGYVTYITDKSKLKKGDWCFWAKGSSCPSSHVAMFVSYADSGYGNFFGQNQGGNGGFRTVRIKLDILGAFRFKSLQAEAPEWKKEAKGWRYIYPDGTAAKNKWLAIGGKKYHFDASGYMQTGWIQLSGKWYYLKSDGSLLTSDWLEYKGKWYFLGKDGAMFIGKHTVPVYFNKDGALIGKEPKK